MYDVTTNICINGTIKNIVQSSLSLSRNLHVKYNVILEISGENVNVPVVKHFVSKSPLYFSYKEKSAYF